MRDTLRPIEYFDAFIHEESKRVELFESKLSSETLKEDRVLPVKNKLIQIKLGIIIAEYSSGAPTVSLKNEFESVIDLFLEAWDTGAYDDNLRFASLAALFDVDGYLMNKIGNKLRESSYHDCLIDYILTGNDGVIDKEYLSFPKDYSELIRVVEEQDINILSSYLRKWYSRNSGSPWYNSHKETRMNLYYGYWSFEAAAVAKRLGLDDEGLRNERYYPYDIVHFT